ncbi:MAG: DivIVA domain-containing protein [Clostridia bacterium]|nr:DivIVA domain-containing protein [Clostridia bacterium]
MKFNKSFRGYNVAQVDSYISQQQQRFDQVTSTQKQRIFQLADANEQLRQQLEQHQQQQKATTDSLLQSQMLAASLRQDADNYAKVVVDRAKLFCATWQIYAKTMLNAFSPQEMSAFDALLHKIEQLIAAQQLDSAAAIADANYANPVQKITNATQHAIDLAELLNPDQSLEEMCSELGLI